MLDKNVSANSADLRALEKLLNPRFREMFLESHQEGHRLLFQDMNELNGCFIDIVDDVCSFKLDLGIML